MNISLYEYAKIQSLLRSDKFHFIALAKIGDILRIYTQFGTFIVERIGFNFGKDIFSDFKITKYKKTPSI